MNIFYTQDCPILAAEDHCHRHQIKMILEYCQILSTAHHILDGCAPNGAYKKTHHNHPSAVWTRSSIEHYEWVWLCAKRLCELYTLRTGKAHKTEAVIDLLTDAPENIDKVGFTNPPAVVAETIIDLDVCLAYRAYLNDKFKEWLGRDKPLSVVFDIKPEWVTI